MKCYIHEQAAAIGLCKHCQKALCPSCATDLEHGLACKGQHEADVEFLNTLISRSKKSIVLQPQSAVAGNISWLFMGIIFAGFGFYQDSAFLQVFGLACTAYWVYLAVYNSAVFKKLETKEP